MYDRIDRNILAILQNDGNTPKAEIARQSGLAASVVSERIRRMKADGLIVGYDVRLSAQKMGKPLLAFVFVTDAKPSTGFDIASALSQVTGLEELHKIAGDDCYLLKLRASDTDELNSVIETEISPVSSVTRVRTTIVLKAIREGPPMSGHRIGEVEKAE